MEKCNRFAWLAVESVQTKLDKYQKGRKNLVNENVGFRLNLQW